MYIETEELAVLTSSVKFCWSNLYVIEYQLTNEAEGPTDDSSVCCGSECSLLLFGLLNEVEILCKE